MSSYFDAMGQRLDELLRNHENHDKLNAIEDEIVRDVTLVAEWPGCPPSIQQAIHRTLLRFAPSAWPPGTSGGDPDYEDYSAYVRGILDMNSDLHSIFHDLARMQLRGFSDNPKSPMRWLLGIGEERREQMVPLSVRYAKAGLQNWDTEAEKKQAAHRIARRIVRQDALHGDIAVSRYDAVMTYLLGDGPEPKSLPPAWLEGRAREGDCE